MSTSDLDQFINDLQNGKLLTEIQLRFLCSKLCEISALEQNVVAVSAPVTVVGDIHGYYEEGVMVL